MLTGNVKYNDLDYFFLLDENENRLQLIPIEKPSYAISNFQITTIEPEPVKNQLLVGKTNENGKVIVFVTICGSHIKRVNKVLFLKIYAYFLLDTTNTVCINKISFSSPEIDRIFDVNRAFNLVFDINQFIDKGIVTIQTADFESTSTASSSFSVGQKEVSVSFEIIRNISTQFGKPPLSLNSCMCFEFEATDDYSFLVDLCHYARNFIRFLCFRKNIFFTAIDVYTSTEDGKHLKIGKLHIINDNHKSEEEPNLNNQCIKYEYIQGKEGRILSDIVLNSLFLRHLPKTYADSKHIDIASFIMITAAFEWEFNRSYPDGIDKSEQSIEIEESISSEITKLMDSSTGKKKKKYKYLLKCIKNDPLKSKITKVVNDYIDVIGDFGKNLYQINNMEFNSKSIGERVTDQRNHYAHGDLDKDFINESLLDVNFLEYVVYALQLRSVGLSDENIRKSINSVFHLNYAL